MRRKRAIVSRGLLVHASVEMETPSDLLEDQECMHLHYFATATPIGVHGEVCWAQSWLPRQAGPRDTVDSSRGFLPCDSGPPPN
jgi:hypothetical protein